MNEEREKRTADLGKAIAIALRRTREEQKLDPLHQDVYTREETIEKDNPMKRDESTLVDEIIYRTPPNEPEKEVSNTAVKLSEIETQKVDKEEKIPQRPVLIRRKSCF